MKNAIFGFSLLLVFMVPSTAKSAMMEIKWTGTIGILDNDPEYPYGLSVGDKIWISAVFDDSGTEMHRYTDGGSTVQTFYKTPSYSYLSDASITFSDNMQFFVDTAFGVSDEYYTWTYKAAATGNIFTQHKLNGVTVDLRSAGPGIGYIDNYGPAPINAGRSDGKLNPIYFSSLTYSIEPYSTPPEEPIPEPTTMLLLSAGLLGVVGSRFAKRSLK